MKIFISFISALLMAFFPVLSQQKSAPVGFDSFRSGIPHGKTDTLSYYSTSVDTMRKVLVYTPPGFSKEKSYPVLYLLHGIGGDENEWFRHGSPEIILDNLYAEKKIMDMLVVLPNGRAMKNDRPVGNIFDSLKVKAFADFDKDLVSDLIPFIEKSYPVLPGNENRALAGLSMGGGQSLNFGLSMPGRFGWIGGFSSAPNTRLPAELIPDPETVKKEVKLIWISCGEDDGLRFITDRTHQLLEQEHINHIFFTEPGSHDFRVWKNDLYWFSMLLFRDNDLSGFPGYSDYPAE